MDSKEYKTSAADTLGISDNAQKEKRKAKKNAIISVCAAVDFLLCIFVLIPFIRKESLYADAQKLIDQ